MTTTTIERNVLTDAPPERARAVLKESGDRRLHPLGLRATDEGPGRLVYRPRLAWPLILWAWRRLRGDGVTFSLMAAGSRTAVAVEGRLSEPAVIEVDELLGGDLR